MLLDINTIDRINDVIDWALANGGATIDANTLDDKPYSKDERYLVSMQDYEVKTKDNDEAVQAIARYIEAVKHHNSTTLEKKVYIGLWYSYDEDILYIDLSKGYASLDTAYIHAIYNNQKAIFDSERDCIISLERNDE